MRNFSGICRYTGWDGEEWIMKGLFRIRADYILRIQERAPRRSFGSGLLKGWEGSWKDLGQPNWMLRNRKDPEQLLSVCTYILVYKFQFLLCFRWFFWINEVHFWTYYSKSNLVYFICRAKPEQMFKTVSIIIIWLAIFAFFWCFVWFNTTRTGHRALLSGDWSWRWAINL